MPVKKSNHNELQLLGSSLKDSVKLLRKNDPLRMAGATAFFTTFALPPIIFILAQIFGLFIGRRTMGRGLIEHLSNTLGKEGAEQVRQVIRSILSFSDDWYVIIIGFIFLFFVATTLFSVIKNSLDQLWLIGVKERPGFLFALSTRARSMVVILFAGLLFFADLLFESVEMLTSGYIDRFWHDGGAYFKSIASKIGSVVIVSAWFILLFRFLADARPSWKASIAGGLLTGILFTAGRWVLKFLLVNSNIGLLYGAGGSFALILLFVFYSSFILYYGACFIAVYSEKKKWPLKPNTRAYVYKIERT